MTREEAIKILEEEAEFLYGGDAPYNKTAFDMAIEALHQKGAYEQTKWERDMALQTLKEHGIGLGQKYEPSTDAEEEALHKILARGMIELPQEYVSVVRCKDCKHQEHCYETVAHTRLHDGFKEHWSEPIKWCSRGERREQ